MNKLDLSTVDAHATDDSLTLSIPEEQLATKKLKQIPAYDSTNKRRVEVRYGDLRILIGDSESNSQQESTANRKHEENAKSKPTVHDVAACILQQCGEMTAMKLQKLVYYCQAWSLVWDEEPLFEEEIQAWANGPVVPVLYELHQGKFKVRTWNGNPAALTEEQCETIRQVIAFYGDKPSQVLSDLTHREDPWVNARIGLGIGERGNRVITHASMAEYYGSL